LGGIGRERDRGRTEGEEGERDIEWRGEGDKESWKRGESE